MSPDLSGAISCQDCGALVLHSARHVVWHAAQQIPSSVGAEESFRCQLVEVVKINATLREALVAADSVMSYVRRREFRSLSAATVRDLEEAIAQARRLTSGPR